MVVYNAIKIGNNLVTDGFSLSMKNTMGDNNSTGSFRIELQNRNGINSTKFNVGDVVTVYADTTMNPLTAVFPYTFDFTFGTPTKVGLFILEDIDYIGKEQDEKMILSGRDYGSKLQDVTIEPVVYSNQEVSLIVKNIISNEVTGITTTNVQVTTTTLSKKKYNHVNCYDAIKELAELSDFYFYVDVNMDLHFAPLSTVSSGIVLNSSNVTDGEILMTEQGMVNSIWVYGDRQLFAVPTETFIGDGTGSVFTTKYNPNNTLVKVSGAQKKGDVFNQLSTAISGQDYLVDYENSKIIFTSGTLPGNNIPGNLVNVTVDYQRSVPIVKQGDDDTSITSHGIKEDVVIDKNIKDPKTAVDIVNKTLQLKKSPFMQGTLRVQGVTNLTPGTTILVNLPQQNISSQVYTILEANYEFNPENNFSEQVMTVKIADKVNTFVDTIKKIFLQLRKLEATDASDSDIISRLKSATGSAGLRVSSWQVLNRGGGLGSSFIVGVTPKATGPTYGARLGSTVANGICFLGDSRSALTVLQSGGEV